MERGARGVKGERPYPATTREMFYVAVMNSSPQASTADTCPTQRVAEPRG
jgi:hypothetical protein